MTTMTAAHERKIARGGVGGDRHTSCVGLPNGGKGRCFPTVQLRQARLESGSREQMQRSQMSHDERQSHSAFSTRRSATCLYRPSVATELAKFLLDAALRTHQNLAHAGGVERCNKNGVAFMLSPVLQTMKSANGSPLTLERLLGTFPERASRSIRAEECAH